MLGETSSRQLRAAGKMEDVIFGGTRRRGAMGFAQGVRLTLDNADHTFDVDADEVTIGRKYYRSRRRRIHQRAGVPVEGCVRTFAGYRHRPGRLLRHRTGRIAEIVAAKSSERREIFEEACGIAKYRYRKNEAERRLAAAAENLERLRDILDELEARVGPLEKESAKAQRSSSSAPSGRRWKSPSGPTVSTARGKPCAVRCGTTRPLRPSMSGLTGRREPPSPRLRRSGCRHSS